MPNPHAERNAPTVVSGGMHISGNLVSDGDVRIDGCVEGDVQSPKCVISENGSVLGSVFADEVTIHGSVSGHVYARVVTLTNTARVALDITYGDVIVEPGAAVEGRLKPVASGDELYRIRPATRLLPGSSLRAIPAPPSSRPVDPVWAVRPSGDTRPYQTGGSSLWPSSASGERALEARELSRRDREGRSQMEARLNAEAAGDAGRSSAISSAPNRALDGAPGNRAGKPSPETALGFEIEAEPVWEAEPENETIFVSTTGPQAVRAATVYPLRDPGRAEQSEPGAKRVQMPITLQTRGSKPRRSRSGILTLVALAAVAGSGLYLGSLGLFQVQDENAVEQTAEMQSVTDGEAPERLASIDEGQNGKASSEARAQDGLAAWNGAESADVPRSEGDVGDRSQPDTKLRPLPDSPALVRGVESAGSADPPAGEGRNDTIASRITAATNARSSQDGQEDLQSAVAAQQQAGTEPTPAQSTQRSQIAAVESSQRAIDDFKAGMDASQADRFDQAIARFSPAIASGKLTQVNLAAAYRNRARAYSGKGDYRRAVADYSETIKLLPGDAVAYNNRGYAYNKLGLPEKALIDINKAIELSPGYSYAYSNRCWAHRNLGERANAISDCEKALSLNPRLDFARRTLNKLKTQP